MKTLTPALTLSCMDSNKASYVITVNLHHGTATGPFAAKLNSTWPKLIAAAFFAKIIAGVAMLG